MIIKLEREKEMRVIYNSDHQRVLKKRTIVLSSFRETIYIMKKFFLRGNLLLFLYLKNYVFLLYNILNRGEKDSMTRPKDARLDRLLGRI